MFNSPRRRDNVRVVLFIGNVARTVQCQAASGAQASSQGQGHSAQRTIFVGSPFGFFSDSCFYQSKCCKSRIFRNNLQSSKRTCLHQNFSVCSPSVHSEPPAVFSVAFSCDGFCPGASAHANQSWLMSSRAPPQMEPNYLLLFISPAF